MDKFCANVSFGSTTKTSDMVENGFRDFCFQAACAVLGYFFLLSD